MQQSKTACGKQQFPSSCNTHGSLIIAGLLFGVILGGSFLRFHQLGIQSFWIDEAFSTAHAQAIIKHGYPLLDTDMVSWSYFPAHYLMALGLLFTSDLHVGARFFSALAGTLACLAFFRFNWQVTQSKIQALTATCLLTFSTYEIAWSRQARGYILLQLCGIVSVGCYLAFLRKPRIRSLAGALLTAAICPLLHPAGYMFPLMLILLTIPELVSRRTGHAWFKSSRQCIALSASALLLVTGFALVVHFTNADLRTNARHILSHSSIHDYSWLYLRFLHSILGAVLWWSLWGTLVGVWLYPRWAIPTLAANAIYFYLIACRNPLMHYRYLLPIIPFLLCFATIGVHALAVKFWQQQTRPGRSTAIVLLAAFLVTLGSLDWNVRPYDKYYLGATEPQPEWRAAYAWIKEDQTIHHATSQTAISTTISAFPVFHDLYLGRQGEKYFLPVSLTGLAHDVPEQASYSRAHTVHSIDELIALKGYIILDEMGLTMLCDKRMQIYLQGQKPDIVIPGFYKIYIWKQGVG